MGVGLLVAACSPAQTATTGAATAHGTAQPSASSTADCDSITTCYTPQQLKTAYGVQPLLQRPGDPGAVFNGNSGARGTIGPIDPHLQEGAGP